MSLHYNGENSYIFVNGVEIHKFKAKDFEIKAAPSCLGNTSKDFLVNNMKNTGFHGYVYDFSVDYDAIGVDDILDIHKYLDCKCRLDAGVCNDRQRCNNDKCRCECKELINKIRCEN